MHQDSRWTLSDSSLNVELYHKDHLFLIEKENIKFSKLIIETLQDILSSLLSSELSLSSCLSQSSLIISPPLFSLLKSNLPSVKTISRLSTSQSLPATATPFNPKCQNFFFNSPTAPPKFQTSASPPFQEVFPSLF